MVRMNDWVQMGYSWCYKILGALRLNTDTAYAYTIIKYVIKVIIDYSVNFEVKYRYCLAYTIIKYVIKVSINYSVNYTW